MNLAAMEALAKADDFFWVDPYIRRDERWLCAIGEAAFLAVRLDGREPPTNRVGLGPLPLTSDPFAQPHQIRDTIEAARVIHPVRADLYALREWLSKVGPTTDPERCAGWFGDVLLDCELVLRYLAPVEPDQRVSIHLRGPLDAVRFSGASWCALVMPCRGGLEDEAAPRWRGAL